MAIPSLAALNLGSIPLQGLRLENLAVAPSSPQPGVLYFDTALGYARLCLTASPDTWLDLTTVTPAGFADGSIALAKLATDPLARANHTGTQTAATISDLTTAINTAIAAARLDQLTAPTTAVSAGSQRITNLADPTTGTDATNQDWVTNYVLSRVNGLDWKASVRAMAATNISTGAAPSSVDGVTLATGDRVLLTGQSAGADNGIYTYNGAGNALTRATDADASAEVTGGLTTFVNEGTTYHDTIWSLNTNDAITVGTTALTFQQIGAGTSYSVSTPITLTGTTIGLTTVPVATGGTGATTAGGARTALGVAQKGFAADVGALTAGVGLAIAHGLGTADLVVMIRNTSTGAMVLMDVVVDATNITLTSATALSSATLRVTAVPVA
jgi:hypothetical protein